MQALNTSISECSTLVHLCYESRVEQCGGLSLCQWHLRIKLYWEYN